MPKTCVICGIDCSERPRVKDARNRYYCRPCYDGALEAQHARAAAAPPPPPPPVEDAPFSMEELLGEVPAVAAAQAPSVCPKCGCVVERGAALCTGCGLRLDGSGAVATALAPPLAPDRAPRDDTPWLWLVYLYIMPARFFRMFAESTPGLIVAIFFWIFGAAVVHDKIEWRRALAQASGREFWLPDRWDAHWAALGVAGLLGGLCIWAIGGWWYRVRIGWSGDADPDRDLARRVYGMSSLVWALPALITVTYHTVRHGTPSEVQTNLGVLDILTLIMAFWCRVTSFFGVCTVFDVRRWKAAIWFIALPLGFQCVAIAAIVGAAIGLAAIASPRQFSSDTISFAYPGNWRIDDTAPDFDPDGSVRVTSMRDAYMHVMVYYSDNTPEGEVERSFGELRGEAAGQPGPRRLFTESCGYEGSGREEQYVEFGESVIVSIFAAPLGDGRMLEIVEYSAISDLAFVEPGFEVVRSTLIVQ